MAITSIAHFPGKEQMGEEKSLGCRHPPCKNFGHHGFWGTPWDFPSKTVANFPVCGKMKGNYFSLLYLQNDDMEVHRIMAKVQIETSARHVHVTQETLEILLDRKSVV